MHMQSRSNLIGVTISSSASNGPPEPAVQLVHCHSLVSHRSIVIVAIDTEFPISFEYRRWEIEVDCYEHRWL